MIKVLFVCLGNICRSPMAEFIFKSMIEKIGMTDKFIIDSSATSTEEIGNSMHYGTVNKLKNEGIRFIDHRAKQIQKSDYSKFDYIIGMERKNIVDIIEIIGNDNENKVYRLLDFSNNPRDIADPWYTGNFDITYKDIVEGCEGLLKNILKNKK